MLLVTITRQARILVSTRPTHDREGGGVDHDNETEDAEENIAGFSETSFGDAFEMEHWLDYVSRRMKIVVQGRLTG